MYYNYMVSMRNTKTQIMENFKNCQIGKKQRTDLKLQMNIILPSNISNKIAITSNYTKMKNVNYINTICQKSYIMKCLSLYTALE